MIPHDEIEVLIREALIARGTGVPDIAAMTVRCNHKGPGTTIRLVFDAPLEVRDSAPVSPPSTSPARPS